MPSPATWNTLGLGVGVSLLGLGLAPILQPYQTAKLFGFEATLQGNESRTDVPALMTLFGVRDVSVAAALLALGAAQKNEEMGIVIRTLMFTCGADIFIVWRNNRKREAVLFTVGALIWGIIGLGLQGAFD